ncbi:uncharacterized protein LOC135332133 isoform X2 [Halichondria panicea]|uniref:uncharacterized protein LOC135332133 isoform X2 n=1 Tax=Halichondria panicea TaxID=6063 RepID=UPI00312B9D38
MSPLNVSLLVLAFCLLLQCGDVKPNPGPTNPGYKVMLSCGEEIVEGLSRNLKAIALSLLAKDLISLDVYEETIKLNETNTDKARRLHLKVLKLVQQSPEKYEVFVEVFQQQQNQLCGDIVLALNTSYNQHEEERIKQRDSEEVIVQENEDGDFIRSDSLATSATSDFSSPPTSPMSWSSASSPSSSLTGPTFTSRKKRVDMINTKNLTLVKRHFSIFLNKVKKGFKSITLDMKEFKTDLITRYPDNTNDISGLEDTDSIFTYFINGCLWDFWNCDDLCEVINTYGNEAMLTSEKRYQEEREHYFATTTLTNYLFENSHVLSRDTKKPKITTAQKRSSVDYRYTLSVKLDVEVSTHTLKYIEELWKKMSYLGLPKIGVILDKIVSGCVRVIWFILREKIASEFRKRALQPEAAEFYKENIIIQVLLNDECLYSTKDFISSITSDVFKLSTSESIEEEPAETKELSAPEEEPAETKELSAPEEEPAETKELSAPEEEPAETKELSAPEEEPAETKELSAPEEEPAETKELSAPEEEPAETKELSAPEEEPAETKELSAPEEEPAETKELSAPEEEPAETKELSAPKEEPGETQDEETESLEEEESTVNDAADEVKSKEKDSVEKDISDEPVKSEPPAKEQSTGITISEKLLAECRSKTADIEVVRGYLEQEDCDANIRENDDFRWSPLMWALENKHFEICKLLLEYKPQVHIQDKKAWSPLVLACRAGDLEIVQGIVALGAEIDLPTNTKWTPLMWAAQEGHVKMATFLLEKGAFVDFPDENGWTPVMQASQGGHVGVINILLDHNAKVNHQTETTWCALMAAAKNKHSDAVDTLLKRGAQVDIQRDDGSTTLQVASYYKGNSAVMKTLIKHGANIDHLNKDGMTALMLATNKGHLGVVQDLIQGGADTNKQHPETGWTPIFFAAKSGKMDIFKELLYNGAKTEIEGRNVVDVASMFKREEMLSELKTFEQASHRIISSSVNPPSLEAAEPTSVEQEPSITEPKVEISPEEVTKPEQKLAEDSTEEVIIEPPQLPDPEAVKPSLSTTEELSQMDTKATKEKKSEAKKSSKDIEKEAKIIELLLMGFANRMVNPSSNKYRYEKTNIADVIGGKGVKSFEEITHKHFSGTPSIQRAIAISEDPDDNFFL